MSANLLNVRSASALVTGPVITRFPFNLRREHWRMRLHSKAASNNKQRVLGILGIFLVFLPTK